MPYFFKLCQILICALFLTAASGFASAKPILYFLNWTQYVAPNVIPTFEAQTGISVQQNYFDGDDMLNAELIAGNSGYDLALPGLITMQEEIPAGVLTPLDKSQLPNYKYIDPNLYKIAANIDPDNTYGIIYDYGTTGIAYNVDAIRRVLGPDVNIDSWDFIYNPKYLKKLQSCGVSFLDDSGQVFGITMHYLGIDPQSTNKADLLKAANYLSTIRPYLTYFNNDRYIDDLASGNICIAMGYSGDVLRAQQQADIAHDNVHLVFVLPKSGAPIWFDMLVIPKNAPHPKAAYAFINYLLQPKIAADTSNYLMQPNAVLGSAPYLNPILKQPNVTPSKEMMSKLFNLKQPPLDMKAFISELWFEVCYGINLANI